MQTFIYPYKQKSAQGDELKYSLRSLCQNFKEDFKVVIVGDKPEWLSDNARVIAGDFDKSKNPAINVAEKLLKILKDPKIPFNFTWMNDDIYFVNTVTIEDIINQIIGSPILDEFDNYTDLRAVAAANAKTEHLKHKKDSSEPSEIEEPQS